MEEQIEILYAQLTVEPLDKVEEILELFRLFDLVLFSTDIISDVKSSILYRGLIRLPRGSVIQFIDNLPDEMSVDTTGTKSKIALNLVSDMKIRGFLD